MHPIQKFVHMEAILRFLQQMVVIYSDDDCLRRKFIVLESHTSAKSCQLVVINLYQNEIESTCA